MYTFSHTAQIHSSLLCVLRQSLFRHRYIRMCVCVCVRVRVYSIQIHKWLPYSIELSSVLVSPLFHSFHSVRSLAAYCVIHLTSMRSTKCTHIHTALKMCICTCANHKHEVSVLWPVYLYTNNTHAHIRPSIHPSIFRRIWAIWWNDKHESWLIQPVNRNVLTIEVYIYVLRLSIER